MQNEPLNNTKKRMTFGGFLLWFVMFTFGFFVVGFLVSMDAVPSDPNDPAQNPEASFELAERALARHYTFFATRMNDDEIDQVRVDKEMAEYAKYYASILQRDGIKPSDSFRFGQVLRTGRQWQKAYDSYAKAQVYFKNNGDLWVNSTLRMAHCQAALGNEKEAISLMRESFKAAPGDKVGILLAALYEVTPPLQGKASDRKLALLLFDCIDQHLQSVVDPKSMAGAQFVMARRSHLQKALLKAAELLGPTASEEDRMRYQKSVDEVSKLNVTRV